MLIVFVVLVLAVVLFVFELVSVDFAALIILVLLIASGALAAETAFRECANPALLTVAFMFVLSEGLARSGAVALLGNLLAGVGRGRERRMLLVLALAVIPISAFMNNTPVVVVLVPVLLGVAARQGLAASRLLMPLSFFSIVGGFCTLLGTSTNLIVSDFLEAHKLAPLGMFELLPVGLVVAAVAVVVVLTLGQRLLPRRATLSVLAGPGTLTQYLTEVHLSERSPLRGKALRSCFQRFLATGGQIMQVVRAEEILPASHELLLDAGDYVLLEGSASAIVDLHHDLGASVDADPDRVRSVSVCLAEVVVRPNSKLIGQSPREAKFRSQLGVTPIAVQQGGRHVRTGVGDRILRLGDTLLVQDVARLDELRDSEDLFLVEGIERAVVRRRKAPLAIAIMGGVSLAIAGGLLTPLAASFLGSFAMLVSGCLRLRSAYRALNLPVLVLILGSLALGKAMESSGAALALAELMLQGVGNSPRLLLAGVFTLTMLLTNLISNNAAAILMLPIALTSAQSLNCDPRPFLIAIAFGASCAFATPIGYQTNLFVYGPGGYRFSDFLKLGGPLCLLVGVTVVGLVPLFWPLQG